MLHRSVVKTQLNIYGGAFLRKYFTAKSSILYVRLGSKNISGLLLLNPLIRAIGCSTLLDKYCLRYQPTVTMQSSFPIKFSKIVIGGFFSANHVFKKLLSRV